MWSMDHGNLSKGILALANQSSIGTKAKVPMELMEPIAEKLNRLKTLGLTLYN